MKRISLLLLLVALSLSFSCKGEYEQSDVLNKSEALLSTSPDSAYILLNSIIAPGQMNDPSLARWCMLTGKIANEIHEDMPYSDLLVRAQAWYRKHGTAEEQAHIGLFLGRSYAEEKAFEKAMTTYMDALETADKNENYNQAGYISSYIADLYEFKEMSNEARNKYEEGAAYFLKAGNDRSYALALRDIAYTWALTDSVNNAFIYMFKADSIACSINDRRAMASIANGLGNLYKMKKDYQNAEVYLLKSLNLEDRDNAPSYLALSNLHTNSGNMEKARFFLKKIKSNDDNPSTSIGAIYQRYLIEKAVENTGEALKYLELYDAAADSITTLQNESNILKIEKKYQQEKLLTENSQLYIEKQRYFIMIILSVIVCLIILSLYQRKLKKQQCEMYQQQITLDKNKFTLIKLNEKIQNGENELYQANSELKRVNEQIEKQEELEEQQYIYEQQKTELEQINNEIIQVRKERLFASSIAKKVIKLSKSVTAGVNKPPLTVKDWKTIQQHIDNIYISLPQLIRNEVLLFTPTDIECCYLSFFDLDPQAEAILLNINPNSASRRRSRLRKKLGIKGEDKSLYEYLSKL